MMGIEILFLVLPCSFSLTSHSRKVSPDSRVPCVISSSFEFSLSEEILYDLSITNPLDNHHSPQRTRKRAREQQRERESERERLVFRGVDRYVLLLIRHPSLNDATAVIQRMMEEILVAESTVIALPAAITAVVTQVLAFGSPFLSSAR